MSGKADGLAIDLHHVAKVYGRRVHALCGIEMQVGRGEVFGLLGPNGAGKTTLVKIMMTVTRATRADGTILGRPIGHKPTLRQIGYLPEGHRIPPYLTARQALHYYAALSNVDRRTRKRRTDELLELVAMSAWADKKIGTYSKGMTQRIALAQALLHEPELIVLDEPTDALDPMGRRSVRAMLAELREQGKTVFVNSHLLGEVETVCDRVAILKQGQVVRQGRLDEMMEEHQWYEVELEGADMAAACDVIRGALPGLDAGSVKQEESAIRLEGLDAAGVQPAIDALRARGMIIRSVRPAQQSLEDLFVETVSDASPTVGSATQGGER